MVEDFSEVGVLTFLWATQFCSSWNITKFPVSFRKGDDIALSLPSMGCILHLLFPWILSLYTMLAYAKLLKKTSRRIWTTILASVESLFIWVLINTVVPLNGGHAVAWANRQVQSVQILLCPAARRAYICDKEGTVPGGGTVNPCSAEIQLNTGGNIAFISLASSHQSW